MHLFSVAVGPYLSFSFGNHSLILLGDATRGVIARGKKADGRNEKSGYKFVSPSLTARIHANHWETSLRFLISLFFFRVILLEASFDKF